MLQVRDLCVSVAGDRLLDAVSFSVDRGEVVCLTGANGSGKTTLLRCIAGRQPVDAGRVVLERGTRIALLPQEEEGPLDIAVEERIWWHQGELRTLRAGVLAGDPAAIEAFQERGGFEREGRLAEWARRLGVDSLRERPCTRLSRGQLRKVDLAGVLAADVDLWILDEPVNFLDLRGISTVEAAVCDAAARGRAVLLVSHDRELVDAVAHRTVHIERGAAIQQDGGYSDVLARRRQDFETRSERAAELRRQIRSLEVDARRRMGWGHRTEAKKRGAGAMAPMIGRRAKKIMKRAKAVERRVDRKIDELQAARPFVEKPLHLAFPSYEVPRRRFARLDGVMLQLGARSILCGADLDLESLDRVAILGDNGAGKTTLLRLLTGELVPAAGRVERHPSIDPGVVPQGLAGFFERERLLDNFTHTGRPESEIRQFLGAVRLRREKALQPVESLSVGERMRAALVRLILERRDFLVLDEPTAHLDLESIEVLEELLGAFQGGFVLVSHDRRLVSNTCSRIQVLEEGRLREP